MDVKIANGVRCDLRVPPTTVRQVFYTTRVNGGLHISSLVVEHLASCARELQAELEGGSDKATCAARDVWDQVVTYPLLSFRPRSQEAALKLAGHQLYIREAREKTLS